TCTRPVTGALKIDVRTVRPFHSTSRGRPTFTDRSFILSYFGPSLSETSRMIIASSRPRKARGQFAFRTCDSGLRDAALPTLAQRTSFRATANVWNFFAECRSQINLMVLLLHQDLANLFRHRVLSRRFALRDAFAIIANSFVFIIKIVAEHVPCILRCADRL